MIFLLNGSTCYDSHTFYSNKLSANCVIHVMKSAPSHRIIIFHSVMHVIRAMRDKHFMSPVTVRRFIGGQGVILITDIT